MIEEYLFMKVNAKKIMRIVVVIMTHLKMKQPLAQMCQSSLTQYAKNQQVGHSFLSLG